MSICIWFLGSEEFISSDIALQVFNYTPYWVAPTNKKMQKYLNLLQSHVERYGSFFVIKFTLDKISFNRLLTCQSHICKFWHTINKRELRNVIKTKKKQATFDLFFEDMIKITLLLNVQYKCHW